MTPGRRAMLIAGSVLALFLEACTGSLELPAAHGGPIHTDCWFYFDHLTGYVPREPKSLDDLPLTIRSRVTAHLKARLGPGLYGRLRFSGGEVIDIDALHRVSPASRNYKWTVPSYALHFELPFADRGIDRFCAQIDLDRDGSVLNEITLPNAAQDVSKRDIVAKQVAMEVARANGVPVDQAWVELGYDRALDSMVWLFSYSTKSEGSRFGGLTLHVNAHNGRFISWSEYEGVT